MLGTSQTGLRVAGLHIGGSLALEPQHAEAERASSKARVGALGARGHRRGAQIGDLGERAREDRDLVLIEHRHGQPVELHSRRCGGGHEEHESHREQLPARPPELVRAGRLDAELARP